MLSNKHARILIAAEKYMLQKGWWPTLAELADLIGTSPSTIRHHLQRIERAGIIEPNLDSHAGSYKFCDLTADAEEQS